ncbi:PhzF family phenazine biosynthesis protein [Chitinimonas lacunae]|uniref:PhzF family phenazine biosynthesis protein n=1 Tax=Chitinimonas lacunae TaxID=1963018 RepID=A0ABV8MUF9_9NEIS
MTVLRYRLLNVFAEPGTPAYPLCGNALAVVEDASALDTHRMQAIARQFNLSETVFLLPSSKAAARLRIFSPDYELDFAGHPTLGSAEVVRALHGCGDRFELELNIGPLALCATDSTWTLEAAAPRWRPLDAERSTIAAALDLPPEAIEAPALRVSCGTEQALVPLSSPEQVLACRPSVAGLQQVFADDPVPATVYVFARTEQGFESRFFWLQNGAVAEDPGTGSACANLGGWWLATGQPLPLRARIEQGRSSGRLNVLGLEVDRERRIFVSGTVVELGSGELRL